jgi:A/G-specific adenine glycosylase
MDVNVRRIVRRVGFGDAPAAAGELDRLAARWVDRDDPGGWNQALMDIGREHCRAIPRCDGCPLTKACRWRRSSGDGASIERVVRRQQPFVGSMREVRGRVVDVLRARPSAGRAALVRATGFDVGKVGQALNGLVRDGVVERSGRSYRLPM